MPFIDVPVSALHDRLRLVEVSGGGVGALVLDLENGTTFVKERDSFTVAVGAKRSRKVQLASRWGGERVVGETHENTTVSANWMVKGNSADEALANLEGFLRLVEGERPGRFLEWRPAGATKSTLFEIRGPGTYNPKYRWVEFSQIRGIQVEVSFPVAPRAFGLPMDIVDPMTRDTTDDYLLDAGTGQTYVWFNAIVAPAGTSTEHRLIHSRGYELLEGQAAAHFEVNAVTSNTKAGVILRRQSADTYLEFYVADTGSVSRLHGDKVVGGVRTALDFLPPVNLDARLPVGGNGFWVRARFQGQIWVAEYFISTPTPTSTADKVLSSTLHITDQAIFDPGTQGIVHKPASSGDSIQHFEFLPFVRRKVQLPLAIQWLDTIPGDVPALADVDITHIAGVGGTASPVFAQVAWSKRPAAALTSTVAPFGILEAENALGLSGWVLQSPITGPRNASQLNDTSPSATSYSAYWLVDPSVFDPDDFGVDIAVEVWARVLLNPSLVAPTLQCQLVPDQAASYMPGRTMLEGQPHRLTVPSSGTPYRPVKIGTLLMPTLRQAAWRLQIVGGLASGSSGGAWGIDYVWLVPTKRRALSPTGKRNDSTYPRFLRSTVELRKVIRSDLRGDLAVSVGNYYADVGLGGAPVEIDEGNSDMFLKLSSLVPDDPTVDSTSEQLLHEATVHLGIFPRFALARPS